MRNDALGTEWMRKAFERMSKRLNVIETELRELRALVTPLDPGGLPPHKGTATDTEKGDHRT